MAVGKRWRRWRRRSGGFDSGSRETRHGNAGSTRSAQNVNNEDVTPGPLPLARRRIQAYASAWILEEIRRTVTHLQAENTFKRHDPWPLIHWFCDAARPVAPAPLGKQRSRDPGDDPFLAAALAAEAAVIVSLDGDLLELGRPFGIEIITPRQLLSRLQRSG